MNDKCYKFELYNTKPILSDSEQFIDATYVLTLEGSERSKTIKKRLDDISITKNNYIVHNKSFKKCYR